MTVRTHRRGFFMGIAALAAMPSVVFAKTVSRFSLHKDGSALRGYDATAYFSAGSAIEGADDAMVQWKGATWRFATPEDAVIFGATPDAFAPQFGGYCTRAMSLGKEVPADPEVWRIHGDRLYVFYAAKGGRIFDEGRDDMIALAQAHWETLTFTE